MTETKNTESAKILIKLLLEAKDLITLPYPIFPTTDKDIMQRIEVLSQIQQLFNIFIVRYLNLFIEQIKYTNLTEDEIVDEMFLSIKPKNIRSLRAHFINLINEIEDILINKPLNIVEKETLEMIANLLIELATIFARKFLQMDMEFILQKGEANIQSNLTIN